ncbi:MAG: prepilin-type N-terminal cleavage/methylation domain-containing protein [Candidatus Nitronauta litoralis]|uniref:Type II secretion system protein H n=1 Tax=Candidatus Nitronauta litoralis TaxID=2705533 RepID=A0A7T0G1V9_9BACT|nr:MAG: prepilin-type N-terminal cleavage/methylation domain-containing protein [Candidatus Nitronauta litoralis]
MTTLKQDPYCNNHRSSGFTLLELILVLVVIAVIASLTLPAFSSILTRMEQRSSVKEITTALRYARSKAVSAKVPVVFQAELENNRYWLEELQTGKVSEMKSLSKGIIFREFFDGEDTTTDGQISIVYFPRGNTSGGALRLSAPKEDDQQEWFEIEIDQITGKPEITNNPYAPEKDNA